MSQALGECAGGLAFILKKKPTRDKDTLLDDIYEYVGFILSYLYCTDKLTREETSESIGYFVGTYFRSDLDRAKELIKTVEFYNQQWKKIKENPNDILSSSIIVHNLLHPNKRDDFAKRIPIEEIDAFKIMGIWKEISELLTTFVPEQINPIIQRIRRKSLLARLLDALR